METLEEMVIIVTYINNDFYERCGIDEYSPLSLSTDGNTILIKFMGVNIWNTEDDMRDYIREGYDEREDLENYLRSEIAKIIKDLGEFNA